MKFKVRNLRGRENGKCELVSFSKASLKHNRFKRDIFLF